MLYVDVIVKQRSKVEELTYAVPASMVPYIRSGSLVSVPLRRQIVDGFVVSLRRTIPRGLKDKIKDVAKLEREQRMNEASIAVVRRLASYYGASLGEVGFHSLDQPYALPWVSESTTSVRPVFFQLPAPKRFSTYLRLIARYPEISFVCIFAQRSFLDAFRHVADKNGIDILLAEDTVRFRKIMSAKIAAGEGFVIASTSSGAFLPLKTGDGLIIDQPSHFGLKQQQRPYMRVKTIAEVRAQFEGLRLFFGDDLPEVSDVVRFQNKELLLRTASYSRPTLTIASRLRSNDVLLPSVKQRIEGVTAKSGRVLVLTLARGWASAYACRECGQLCLCPLCNRTMAVDRDQLICRYDDSRSPLPTTCVQCRGSRFHEIGDGVSKISAEIDRLQLHAAVHELSSDQPIIPKSGVIVATEKVLTFPDQKFDLVVLANLDRLISGVMLNDRWELARLVRSVAATTSELIVQTFFPDDELWTQAVTDLRAFFSSELLARRTWKLPPYGQLIGVTAVGGNASEMQDSATEIQGLIGKIVPKSAVGPPLIVPIGPKRYRATVTFAIQGVTQSQKQALSAELPHSWHLDIEPL